jgi:ankyrin repeat protein
MPADSFESPLTLAACGGHVELANLLLERGANIEEANDEGYTPLMEAAREGHEEMVALLLAHGELNQQISCLHVFCIRLEARSPGAHTYRTTLQSL